MEFLTAYRAHWPTKVIRPNGSEALVIGFALFPDAIVYVDDGCLNDVVTTHPIHLLEGRRRRQGRSLVIAGHEFVPIEHGEPAAFAWRMAFKNLEPQTVFSRAERDARLVYRQHLTERAVQSIAQ